MRAPLSRFSSAGQPPAAGLASPAAPAGLAARALLEQGAARLRRPAGQGLAAFACYTAAWLIAAAAPLAAGLGSARLDQLSMDPNFYTWALRWWPYAISHGLNPFYTHLLRAPQGNSLAWVTSIPAPALLAAPLTMLAGPIVAFNVLTLLALPLSAWAAFVLCRRLTGKFWPALAGGAVFGFSAYQMNHIAAGQLNLVYSLVLPLLVYLFAVWRDGAISSRAFVAAAGLLMAMQFYLFLETFADMTALLGVAALAGVAVAGRARLPEALRAARVVGCAYAAGLALALPYLAYALTLRASELKRDTSLDLASLVLPRPRSLPAMSWLHAVASRPAGISAAGYVGIPLLVIALAAAVTGWRRRLVRLLSCLLVIIVVASLGPALHVGGRTLCTFPWHRLWHLPLLSSAYPSRLMLFAYLVLAVMTALWLASPGASRWLRVPLALLAVAALLQDAPVISVAPHDSVPAFISADAYRQHLAPGETVVVVSKVGNAGMLWQADSGFYMRLAGGYLNQSITRASDLPPPVQALARATPAKVRRFESYVRKAHVGAILLDGRHAPLWTGIFRRIGLTGTRSGDVEVYPVRACRSCRALDAAQIGHRRP